MEKKVENWQKMIAACTGFGGGYKPSNANLTVGSMATLLAEVDTEMNGVQARIVPWKNDLAGRENIYTGVRPRTTQILAAIKVCGAAANNKVDNMKTYQRQVHGARAKAKPVDDPNTPGDESKGNSVSHQTYVQVAESFSQMVALMAADPLYTPNEAQLTAAVAEIGALTGIFTAPEGAACLPALRKLIDQNLVDEGESVVIFNTGSGIKYLEAFGD